MNKIAVVTGSRAEYGLLKPLMQSIQVDPALTLQIIVTGMHLSPEFGHTYLDIEGDGFSIDVQVETQLSSETAIGVAKSVGLGVIGFADALARLKPNKIVLLGDRYEILAAAQAALFAKIPIAHLHGGEITTGAFDESIRHAITKMSHLHFVSAEPYRQRVMQLGENPETVFNVGAIGIDVIKHTPIMSKSELEQDLGFKFAKKTFLVTYHPQTLSNTTAASSFRKLLTALAYFEDSRIIFTKSNADPGGWSINSMIDDFIAQNSDRAVAYHSLGSAKYINCVRHVDVVIGNSSSGIIEVPYLKKPVVNIGDRQNGRIRCKAVVDCPDEDQIVPAIQQALALGPQLQKELDDFPYGDGHAAHKIVEVLKKTKDIAPIKPFIDLIS